MLQRQYHKHEEMVLQRPDFKMETQFFSSSNEMTFMASAMT